MKLKNKIKRILSALGPGLITGASDDDPSGIATYSQTGALFGYQQLWTAVFTFPFMTIIQEMCGRIGLVTGKGLAGVLRKHYSKKFLYFSISLLLIANIINIGADLGAMASSAKLLWGLPSQSWLIFFTLLIILVEILVPYPTYVKILKFLTLSLFSYVFTAFVVGQDWSKVALSTFLPHFSLHKEYLMNLVAILGTSISPYLFFWQADEEVEEELATHKLRRFGIGIPKINKKDLKAMRLDTAIGMFLSQSIMFFIVVTTASTLGMQGINDITTADQAALALRPLAGDMTYLLFACGIIGTGLLAIPVLAGAASYALAEAFKWQLGLSKKFRQAEGFYLVIALATILGLLINFSSLPPFKMLYYTAIINGIVAPPLMLMILLIANNKKIMGKYTNSRISNWGGSFITFFMFLCAVLMLVYL